MSVAPVPLPESSTPPCHAVVHRLPAGLTVADCRARLRESAADGATAGPAAEEPPRVWAEPVPGPSDGPLAARRRQRETRTGISPSAASPLRLTVLEYADGVRDLVVAARADHVGRRELDRTAGTVLRGMPPYSGGEEHGFVPKGAVRADADGLVALAPMTLPAPRGTGREATGPDPARLLTAALALVLARTLGDRDPVLDVSSPSGAFAVPVSALDEDAQVTAFLAAAHTDTDTDTDGDSIRVRLQLDAAPAAEGLLLYAPPLCAPHALTLHAAPDADGCLVLRGWYRPEEFPAALAAQWGALLATAADGLAGAAPDATAAGVELLGPARRREVLELGGLGRKGPAPRLTIPELVRSRAAETPDAIALTDGDTHLSYQELLARAELTARALRGIGVLPGDRVGVCLERTADLVVSLLAVLVTGAAYVTLDPAYPADRLAYTAEDAGLGVVLVDDEAAAQDGPFASRVTVSPQTLLERAATAPKAPARSADPDAPAYVIYTSGSTGRPKGVVVPHRNVAALIATTGEDFACGAEDTWAWFHSAAFDFSVWEIWGGLATGGRVVVVPYWTCRSPRDFRELLVRERVTVLNQTPSAFARLIDLEREEAVLGSVRLVILGGEPLDPARLLPWFDAHPESACRVVNMFGITETTVHVTARTMTREDALTGNRSVGRAIPGWSVRILDGSRRPLPPGVLGEIAVAGDGLAQGYLERPELTAQRFVTAPVDSTRLYLSGDLGMLRPDGELEHHGRIDSQVQLRGHRVEPDEIRHVLLGHEAVRDAAVVVARKEGDEDAARLDGYVVLRGGDAREIRRHAARTLPEYMVPSVVAVPEIPLTVNGKTDVVRLAALAAEAVPQPPAVPPVPETREAPAAGAEAPEKDLDALVLAAWRTVLGTDATAEEDFFDLGGNSLLALRVCHALREAGLAAGVRDIYQFHTAAGLAAELRRRARPEAGGGGS
ncbi:non-ribosomal peptide synthetase [Streptomyces dangxiongensis]|uniref:non-ribosomal peptide synthetase n=1 Tax=Streptomyces dangxiongensis TaxID=1442032 RepID=UPI001F089C18|nr:non-ribosomal peptide synthetase [Streptomyces dangxiongensis]